MSPEQKKAVLGIARRALERQLRGTPAQDQPKVELPGGFAGVFVTLKSGPRLRGCMGTFQPMGSLAETVDHVARMSCCEDPRFAHHRIRADELDDLSIEVSVLGPPVPMRDVSELVPGRHGIRIRQGPNSGCFLPQVATERGWPAEEFLSQCCATKAGLSANAWKDPNTEVCLFEAEVMSETPRGPAPAAGTPPPEP